jgi:hypothetical protein
VSKNLHRKANGEAVRFGPICIEPPQRGQSQVALTAGVIVVSRAGMKSKSLRAKASRAVRQGLARPFSELLYSDPVQPRRGARF